MLTTVVKDKTIETRQAHMHCSNEVNDDDVAEWTCVRSERQSNEQRQGRQARQATTIKTRPLRTSLRSSDRSGSVFSMFFVVSDVLSYLCSSLFGLVVACLSISNVLLKQYVCFSFVCSFKVVVLMLGLFGVCVMKAAKLFLSNHAPCRHLHTSMHPLAAASPLQRQSAKLARSVIR